MLLAAAPTLNNLTLSPDASLHTGSCSTLLALAPSSLELIYWQIYCDCAHEKVDLKTLVTLSKSYGKNNKTLYELYRLAFAVLSYAITNRKVDLIATAEQVYAQLLNLNAVYSAKKVKEFILD
jgi:hypothetical protein